MSFDDDDDYFFPESKIYSWKKVEFGEWEQMVKHLNRRLILLVKWVLLRSTARMTSEEIFCSVSSEASHVLLEIPLQL